MVRIRGRNLWCGDKDRLTRKERRAARNEVIRLTNVLATHWGELVVVAEPAERAQLLIACAELDDRLSTLVEAAYKDDPIVYPGTETLWADVLAGQAKLFRLVAWVESTVAGQESGPAPDEREAVRAIVHAMVRHADEAQRTPMLRDLHDAIRGLPGQAAAAEVLAELPAPGHHGWLPVVDDEDLLEQLVVVRV
jgi:hypothetical protein